MKFDNDLVSIITPTYKASDYVGETIQSVLDQDYQNWELIIVDDYSSDGTLKVLEGWQERDARIKVIPAAKNGGPAIARNLALKTARGRWVAFLDSDDIWMAGKLSKQLVFHQTKGAIISFTSGRRFQGGVSNYGHLISVPKEIRYAELLGNTVIITSTVIVDRNKTGDFKMKKVYYDDFACWLDLLRSGGLAVGLHDDLLRYRVLPGSVSRNKLRSAKEVWKTYREIEKLGLLASVKYFFSYAIYGTLKYKKL